MNRFFDAEGLIKNCPFRLDKKGKMKNCIQDCALYVGKFPNGYCAFYVNAINIPAKNNENSEN